MPKDLRTDGRRALALTHAERQARYRARNAHQVGVTIRYRRPADRRTRPQRWHEAVAELLAPQAEYTAWADRCRTACATPLRPIRSRPSSTSTYPTSSRHADMIAIDPQRSDEFSFANFGENSSAVDSMDLPLELEGRPFMLGVGPGQLKSSLAPIAAAGLPTGDSNIGGMGSGRGVS